MFFLMTYVVLQFHEIQNLPITRIHRNAQSCVFSKDFILNPECNFYNLHCLIAWHNFSYNYINHHAMNIKSTERHRF